MGAYPPRICEFSYAPSYSIEERERFLWCNDVWHNRCRMQVFIAEQGRQLCLLLVENPRRRNRCKKNLSEVWPCTTPSTVNVRGRGLDSLDKITRCQSST